MSEKYQPVADSGFGQGGGSQLWLGQFSQYSGSQLCEQSEYMLVWGLGTQNLLGFSWLNMLSASFSGTFCLLFLTFFVYKILIKTF